MVDELGLTNFNLIKNTNWSVGLYIFLSVLVLGLLVFIVLYFMEKKKFIHLVKIYEETGNGIKYNEYNAKKIDHIENPVLILWSGGIFTVWSKRAVKIPIIDHKNKVMYGRLSNVYEFKKDLEGNYHPVRFEPETNSLRGIPADLKLWEANVIEENVILTTKNDFLAKWGSIIMGVTLIVFVFMTILITMKYWSDTNKEWINALNENAHSIRNNTETVYLALKEIETIRNAGSQTIPP